MSIGPGKALVWRADDLPKKSSTVVRIHTIKPVKQKKKSKPNKTQAPQSAAHKNKGPELLAPVLVKQQLVLSDKQKNRLQALFAPPNALAELLRAHPQKLVTPHDASMFLLTNRKELDGCINPDARSQSIDLLTELLLQWSGTPPESIAIDFDSAYLTTRQKLYLPLEGFKEVEVTEPLKLSGQRKGRLFQQPFSLFEERGVFFIAVTLIPIPKSKHFQEAPLPASQKTIKLKDFRPKEIKLTPGQPLPYIVRNHPQSQPKVVRQRVLYSKFSKIFSSGFSKMNWGGLSGWGVNGGLPSLGKRSR